MTGNAEKLTWTFIKYEIIFCYKEIQAKTELQAKREYESQQQMHQQHVHTQLQHNGMEYHPGKIQQIPSLTHSSRPALFAKGVNPSNSYVPPS